MQGVRYGLRGAGCEVQGEPGLEPVNPGLKPRETDSEGNEMPDFQLHVPSGPGSGRMK
jgi:hypothetical protein